MAPLSIDLRYMLERAIIRAREIAEEEAQAALIRLGVNRNEPFASLDPNQRRLRNALRAKARQLGDGSSSQDIGSNYWLKKLPMSNGTVGSLRASLQKTICLCIHLALLLH
jgi:hypothetical protein